MAREYTSGKCVDCESAFTWKRHVNGRVRRLATTRCPFCKGPLAQTSSQLTRYPWFDLDEVPTFSDPSRGTVGERFGNHHYITVDIDGQRHRFAWGMGDRAFYTLVDRLGGSLPRSVQAHHSGTASVRTLADYPLLREEFRARVFVDQGSDPTWRLQDVLFDANHNYITHVYDRPVWNIEDYLKNMANQEVTV